MSLRWYRTDSKVIPAAESDLQKLIEDVKVLKEGLEQVHRRLEELSVRSIMYIRTDLIDPLGGKKGE